MSTENLLPEQSAERLSESGYSSGIYFRRNSQQPRENLQQKGGLDNPGFERDLQETDSREHSASNRDTGNVLKRSTSLQQVTEGKNIDDAGRVQMNSRIRPNGGSSKKVGLQRQRPKTTSGQDLRRKAFVNSLKLRRARSASYLIVPDEKYEDDVFRINGVFQKSLPKNVTNDRSTGTLKITKERCLQDLSKSVHNTEKDNSHLREYSRRLSAALKERTRLTETLRGVSLNVPDKERELSAYPEVKRNLSAKKSLSAENTPYVRSNSFEELGARPSKENRRQLPETPLSSERNKRGKQEGRRNPNTPKERRHKLTEEVSASAHGNQAEKERKRRAVAKLAEDMWRSQIHGETFQTNDNQFVEDENTNGQATADWGKANNTDVTAGLLDQSESNRTRGRRAAFKKQISFQDDEVTAAPERRCGLKLTRDHPDENGPSRYPYEGATTQLGETTSARLKSRHEELHRRPMHHYSMEDQCGNLPNQEHDVRRMPPYQQPQVMFHERNPAATSYDYMLPHTQNSCTSQSRQQVGKHGERQNSTSRQQVGKHDEGQNNTSHSRQQVGKHDQGQNINGKYSGDVKKESANCESKLVERDTSHVNNNHVGMASSSSSYNGGSFRKGNVERAYNNGRNNKTKATHELPSYDISLMRKILQQRDGYHENGGHDDESTQLANAYMVTEDAEERRELQRRAASEAAVLRREASNLLWKAMDLERICDQNARVRHVLMPN